RKVRRPIEFHLANVFLGALLGLVALQGAGLAVAGAVTGPILLYTILLSGLWGRGVIKAARRLGKD
ncbi:MAG: hypothetical protein KAS81_05880, partial [Anaerolineales bacterium]|nr:hypothetical protein [Anaerolineales bacterium]